MESQFYFARVIDAPFDKMQPVIDFPTPGWELSEGDPRAVGATRSCDHPQAGPLVDELRAYASGEDRFRMTYAIINEDNRMGARGYEGTMTLLRDSQDPSRCFYTYEATWASIGVPVDALRQMMVGAVADMEAAARAV